MLSAKIWTILALLATSATAVSVRGPSGHHPQRRHAHKAVVGARSARGSEGAHAELVAKRNVLPAPRKRGINARRCAPKSTSAVPASSTPSTTSADPAPTDSDTDPEPTTSVKTTSAEPTKTKEATTSDKPTKTSTTVKETPTDDGGSSSGGSGQHTGEATFYGTGLGACGITNKDTDFIAAVSHLLFDGFSGYTGGDPNQNPICNKKATAYYNGKQVTVTITDRCVGCAMYDLDFSPSAFDKLADESLGRLKGMTWSFD